MLDNADHAKIDDFCCELQLTQLVEKPTRVTPTSSTCIDLVMTSHPAINITDVVHIGISDHSMVICNRKINANLKVPPRVSKVRNFKHFNEDLFLNDMFHVPWQLIENESNIDNAWNTWQQMFNDVCNRHAPYRQMRQKRKNMAPWVTKDMLELGRKRDAMRAKAHKTCNQSDWLAAKRIRNQVNNMAKYLKKRYYENAISDNTSNSKKMWSIAKEASSIKTNSILPARANINKQKLTDDFNEFFVNIGPHLAESFEDNGTGSAAKDISSSNQHNTNLFKFSPVTASFVEKQIKQMDPSVATGVDGISSKFLKIACPAICTSLIYLINKSLFTGIVPEDWKMARVTPVFKGGDRDELTNYRPISVLPLVSKLLERAVNEQLSTFLNRNELLVTEQSGFRPHHSTQTVVLDVTDHILNNIDNGKVTGAILLDLKKAFDTVDHEILLSKLYYNGVEELELKWFKSYLSGRKQATKIDGTTSDFANLSVGVPQGSILGPLLFIIFINSLPSCLASKPETKVSMYADDTMIMFDGTTPDTIESDMVNGLNQVTKWLVNHKLTFNVSKTKFMIFGSRPRLPTFSQVQITLNDTSIERVQLYKYLGVILDEHMSWSDHIDFTAKKISMKMGFLRRSAKPCLPSATFKMLSSAMILPLFDYCDVAWSGCAHCYSDKLLKLHNRLARLILNAHPRTHIHELQRALAWLPLPARWENHRMCEVYKCE